MVKKDMAHKVTLELEVVVMRKKDMAKLLTPPQAQAQAMVAMKEGIMRKKESWIKSRIVCPGIIKCPSF